MLLNYEININLKINYLMDFGKLKNLQSNGLKVNMSELARLLGKDYRTISKYTNGFEKVLLANDHHSLMHIMISLISF